MPLETVTVTVEIGTHTDDLPLNGPRLAEAIAKAIENDYAEAERHDLIECESVSIDGENWLPFIMCRNGDHAMCRNQEPHDCRCVCHIRVRVEP